MLTAGKNPETGEGKSRFALRFLFIVHMERFPEFPRANWSETKTLQRMRSKLSTMAVTLPLRDFALLQELWVFFLLTSKRI